MRSSWRLPFLFRFGIGLSAVTILLSWFGSIAAFAEASGLPSLEIEVVASHGVGDGHPATEVPIGSVTDIATDALGNTYFVDSMHLRVRKIRTDGVIETVLNGHELASSLSIESSPRAVAVHVATNALYVADERANRVWVLRETGLELFAGTGLVGLEGDGGPASEAKLNAPVDLAIGTDGTVYVADMANHRIRAVAPDGTISTVVGELPPGIDSNVALVEPALFLPERVAVGPNGTLYVVDRQGRRLQSISAQSSPTELLSTSTVADLATSSNGVITVCSGGRLLKLHSDNWQSFFSGDPQTDHPCSVIEPLGNDLVVYRSDHHSLLRVNPDGSVASLAGNGTATRFGDGGPSNGASFTCQDVAVTANGRIAFSDPLNQRVAIIENDGTLETLAGLDDDGELIGGISCVPAGVDAATDDVIYVADYGYHRILRINADRTISIIAGTGSAGFGGDGGPGTEASFNLPLDVAASTSGELFVADSNNQRVRRIDAQGIVSTIMALEFTPGSLIIGPSGHLLVMERSGLRLVEISLEGPSITTLHGGVAGSDFIPGRHTNGMGIRGNSLLVASDGTLYATSLPLAASFSFTAVASAVPVLDMSGMTIDSTGNLLWCDATRRRILRIPSSELDELLQ